MQKKSYSGAFSRMKKVNLLKSMKYLFIIILFVHPLVWTMANPAEPTSAYAQQGITVTGTIVEEAGMPMPGVNVVVKGTTRGVVTDVQGKYSITVPDKNAVLVFSFMGYISHEYTVGDQTSINITMNEDTRQIEEVVVVGYGTQRKVTLTGAVAAISSDEIITTKSDNVQNMLAGKVAGVKVTQKSSEPGRFDNDFQIRGMGSPLVIIDGVARDNFTKLDANEIESISIMKDGSAAIYGVRAANGVVLITTKKGAKGSAFQLDYSGFAGIQNMINQPEPLDAVGFMRIQNEKALNGGSTTLPYPQSSFDPYLDGTKQSTDWQAGTMRRQAFQTQHSISATGGTEKITYFVNFGYDKQDGFWKSGDLWYKRFNLRSNVTAELAKGLRLEVLMNAMTDTKNQPSSWSTWNLFKGFWTQIPLNPMYLDAEHNYPFFAADGLHPDYMTDADKSGYQRESNRLVQSNLGLEWAIPWVDGLKVRGTYSYDFRERENKNFRKTFNLFTYDDKEKKYVAAAVNSPSQMSRQFYQFITDQLQLSLSYNKLFNSVHNVSALMLYEESNRKADNFRARRDYSMDVLDQLFAGNSTNQVADMNMDKNSTTQNTDNLYDYANKALVGRFTYDYSSKYMAEFSFRYDGSSLFAPGHQWGFFPVGSIGWRMSEENFIKDNLTFVNNLKIRASYGVMGDDRASSYQFLPGFTYPTDGYVFGGNYTNALGMRGLPNPDITWFKAKVINIGLDADFWTGLLGISIDVFQRNRDGLLDSRVESIPGVVGANMSKENLNSDLTRGFELTLSHRNKIGKDFTYNISGNMGYARTKWKHKEFAKAGNSYRNWRDNSNDRWNDLWWGYDVSSERYQSYDEIFSGPVYGHNSKGNSLMLPGDLKYEDWNGDGIIDDNDTHPIGYNTAINKVDANNKPLYNGGMPMINFGFTIGAEYKGFDFNAVFQGTVMNWIRYPEQLEAPLPWNRNGLDMFLDRWHRADEMDPNSSWVSGYWPSTYRDNGRSDFMQVQSTFWMQNAAYLRLKSLELGYTIPQTATRKIGIERLRIFFSAYNLITITGLKYCDPEHLGDDYGYIYPLSQNFNFGLNVSF